MRRSDHSLYLRTSYVPLTPSEGVIKMGIVDKTKGLVGNVADNATAFVNDAVAAVLMPALLVLVAMALGVTGPLMVVVWVVAAVSLFSSVVRDLLLASVLVLVGLALSGWLAVVVFVVAAAAAWTALRTED
jgi:hypothetical protein